MRYLFVFFQLSNVDVFIDIADSCVTTMAHAMNHFFHLPHSACVYFYTKNRIYQEPVA